MRMQAIEARMKLRGAVTAVIFNNRLSRVAKAFQLKKKGGGGGGGGGGGEEEGDGAGDLATRAMHEGLAHYNSGITKEEYM